MRVIVPLANGVEEIEVISIVDILRRAGIEVTTLSLDDSGIDIEGSHGIGLVADEMWEDADIEDADMIVIPGGAHTMLEEADLLDAVRAYAKAGKKLGAICAGPLVLQEAGVLKGRKATCYPGFEAMIPDATVVAGESVVRDGNMITGMGPGFSLVFALGVVEMLLGVERRAEVAKALLIG